MLFHFFLPLVINYVLVHVKNLESLKGQGPRQQKLLSPTEYTAPEMPQQ